MPYIFSGRLCGYVCADCVEPLSDLTLRLYQSDERANVAALAVANPKETFVILGDGDEEEKARRLLAETTIDADGNFTVELGEGYAGEAFEIDVYCASVPRQKLGRHPPKPRQFSITTLQPRYRRTENGYIAVWEYCLPYRNWCAILAFFDVWTICGSVTGCDSDEAIPGVTVTAFDADWIQDDELGSAVTDAAGKFLITYTSADFQLGTFINVELIGGPDLYFTVEDAAGNPLLIETQARGRFPDRENADNCFCVDLCIEKPLVCELSDPTGCTAETINQSAGTSSVTAVGTAGGGIFDHYTLEILQGGTPLSGVAVTYPGGGTTGTSAVVAGVLGELNTTSLMDGDYTIRLTVFPSGAGLPSICTRPFTLLKVLVYINKVGKIPADPQPFDPAAELRHGGTLKAVGGALSIEGAAYVYGCADREVKQYDIRTKRIASPAAEPVPQPATDAPAPAGYGLIPPLPLEYTLAAQYEPWTRVGPAPRDLVNTWKTFTVGTTTYYGLSAGQWSSSDSGRYSMLLVVEDTTTPSPHTYYDIQNLWLDNKAMYYTLGPDTIYTVRIVKFQRLVGGVWSDIPPCSDLLLSFGKVRILGLAWDPVIDEAWWPPVAPNDNFGHYRLDFWKQFGPAHELLGDTGTRHPALPALPPVIPPTYADAEELAQWDLTALDAGPKPTPFVPPPDPKIYQGTSCSYDLQLFATDTTAVNDNSTTHYIYHQVPVKIVNDL